MISRTPPTEDSQSSTAARISSTPLPPTGKAAAVSPKVTQSDDGIELKNIGASGDAPKASLPVEDDIMQLARLGEVAAVQKLFETKKFSPIYKDEEGITPLHWAAINNRYAMCKFLLDSGADVNAKGGESLATPVMWAAQRCYYYVVNLLLQHGADPLLTDVGGYNILHLATMDGNAFLLVLLLQQGIPVDATDPHGHTGLMWAAYRGFPACVDLFLRWGANVNASDEGGLTPLHWALVDGSHPCIQKIIEYGADRFAKTSDGKSPATVAGEMKTTRVWHLALNDCGYDSEGNAKALPFGLMAFLRNQNIVSKFFLFWPFLMIFVATWILSHVVIFAAVPLFVVAVFALQWVAQQVANNGPIKFRMLQKTPYLAGTFGGSQFWVGVRYLTKLLPATFVSHPFLNIFFIAFYSLTAYFYIYAMTEDPGFVPKLVSRNQQSAVIGELFEQWKFDEDNFCIQCMIRKPLRSKHCRRCGRCVAKHDHHCPWIDNCVGANNFRHFVLYVLSLEIGIILFIQLVVNYIEILPPPANPQCNILNATLCDFLLRDTFTLVLTLWSGIQLVWVTMLCAVQMVQISRNQTTYENMRSHIDGIDHVTPSSQAITSALAAGTTSLDSAGLSAAGRGPNSTLASASGPRQRHGCFKQWKRLLGLDTFLATAQAGFGDRRRSSRQKNPFSRGIITNCRDFWGDPAPIFGKREPGLAMLGGEVVNYYRMYETPLRMHSSSRGGSEATYRSLAGEDPEEMV